jgi:hypothetical protein
MKTANRNCTLRAVGTAVAVAVGLTAATAFAGDGAMDANLGAQIHAQTAQAAMTINRQSRVALDLGAPLAAQSLTPQVDTDALAGTIIRQGATAAADIRFDLRGELRASAPYRTQLAEIEVDSAKPQSSAGIESLLQAIDEQASQPLRQVMQALDPVSVLDTATVNAIARSLALSQAAR